MRVKATSGYPSFNHNKYSNIRTAFRSQRTSNPAILSASF